jgi:hypothetical protein
LIPKEQQHRKQVVFVCIEGSEKQTETGESSRANQMNNFVVRESGF